MKKLLLSIWLTASLFYQLSAQAPQQFNYQAIVRNTSGTPVANNTAVTLRFTIHDSNASGTSVFTETQNTTANQFGLVNVQIGSVNNLTPVNWGSGAKFLQVEVDVNNSGTFTDMGTTQILSVPYALHAAAANTKFQTYPGASVYIDSIRDVDVRLPDSMVVTETGTYIVFFNIQGGDNPTNTFTDNDGQAWLSTSSAPFLTDAIRFFDNYYNGIAISYKSIYSSTSSIVNLTAGDVLHIMAHVHSGGGPVTGNWYVDVNHNTIQILKLN